MARCRDRNQFHIADLDPLESRNVAMTRLADTDMGNDTSWATAPSASTCNRRATVGNSASNACMASTSRDDGSIYIDNQGDFGFEALEQALDLGSQIVDADPDGAGFRQHSGARLGQCGLACAIAIEQRQAELQLEIGDRIADRRCRPSFDISMCGYFGIAMEKGSRRAEGPRAILFDLRPHRSDSAGHRRRSQRRRWSTTAE
jgi:hypothetical protein